MAITVRESKQISFLKKVDPLSGDIILVACPGDMQVGTSAKAADLIILGKCHLSGTVSGTLQVKDIPCFKAPLVLGTPGFAPSDGTNPRMAQGSISGIAATTSGSFTIPGTMQTMLVGPITIGDGSVMTINTAARVVIRNFDDF